MKSTRKLIALLVVMLAVLTLGPAPTARARNDHPRVVPPRAHAYAGTGVFVATWLVGPATVTYAAPSGRVADVATYTAGPAISVGLTPCCIAITPNGKTAYVANNDSDTVTPISIATNTAGPAIHVDSGPTWIAITLDGKTAYVANYDDDTLTPIHLEPSTEPARDRSSTRTGSRRSAAPSGSQPNNRLDTSKSADKRRWTDEKA